MIKDAAYHSLADMIYRGSIFLRANIMGYSFIFKTLNEVEYNLVKIHTDSEDNLEHTIKFNIMFMAYSVYMIGNVNVQIEREINVRKLYNFFKYIPSVVHKNIMKELLELRAFAQETSKYLEGFSYTDQSRRVWEIYGRDVYRDAYTGIFGSEKYGLNSFQEQWISINVGLDQEEKYHDNFMRAIMIASASNPKGSRRLSSQHEAKIQSVQEQRKKMAKEGYIDRTVTWNAEGWAVPTDTAEALVAELERQMQGFKDKHDRYIEDYLRGLQEESDRRAQEIEQKRLEYAKKHEKEPLITVEQQALSRLEAERRFAERQNNNLVIVPSDEIASPEQTERFYKKISNRVLTPKE